MFKAVVFDLDDTLYDYETLNREALAVLREYTCRRFLVTPINFENAFNRARAETKKNLCGTGASHNRILYCQKTLELLGNNPADGALDMYDVYWEYMLEHMKLCDGALDLIRYCSDTGIKIGICSDLTAHIQHRKLRSLGIASWVNAIVTSEEAGAEKPAMIMYQMILDKLKVPPEYALFIGDSYTKDVEGPQKAGMKALWFHREGNKEYNSISSFREVREIIHGSKQD